jgi:hypothetical protein
VHVRTTIVLTKITKVVVYLAGLHLGFVRQGQTTTARIRPRVAQPYWVGGKGRGKDERLDVMDRRSARVVSINGQEKCDRSKVQP